MDTILLHIERDVSMFSKKLGNVIVATTFPKIQFTSFCVKATHLQRHFFLWVKSFFMGEKSMPIKLSWAFIYCRNLMTLSTELNHL